MDADVPPLSRAPFTWRLAFQLLASRGVRRMAVAALRAVRAIGGDGLARRLVDRFGAAVVWSNWPRRTPGWINLHASAFHSQLLRALSDRPPQAAGRAAECARPRRVGCLGPFSGLLTFQRRFFEARPSDVELVVYDLAYHDRLASYLEPLADTYHAVRLDGGPDAVASLASSIRMDKLDLLITVYQKRDIYDLLDQLDVPAIANICTGSDLLHHERVSFQIYPQPSADFFPVDDRMFSAVTRRPIDGHVVYPGWILYDPRDLDVDAPRRTWRERDPLIVCHGSLWKTGSPPFLDLVLDLLAVDSTLEFVFMGRDARGALGGIESRARDRGLAGRVHYCGAFSHLRGEGGDVDDPGWRKLCDLLGRARLAPDPWPVGGGSARFEAYLMGAPTVHMGLSTDAAAWGQPQPATIDLPDLAVPDATATSPAAYGALCDRLLSDATFADRVAASQREIARRVGDPHVYWSQILSCHERWFTHASRTTRAHA